MGANAVLFQETMMDKIPERIWLQVYGDEDPELGLPPDDWETTWCEDKINDSDVEYVLASKFEELEAKFAEIRRREYFPPPKGWFLLPE